MINQTFCVGLVSHITKTRVQKGGTTALTDTTVFNQTINAGTRDTLASTCRLKVTIIMESAGNCTMPGTTASNMAAWLRH